MPLTTMTAIKSLQPKGKKYNRGCGDGLYLMVQSWHKGGQKYFYGEYRKMSCYIGKWGTNYNELSLADAKGKWLKIKECSIAHQQHPKNYGKRHYDRKYTLRNAIDDFLVDIALSVKPTTTKEYTYKLNTTILRWIDGETNINELEWDNKGRAKINKVLDNIL